MRFFENVLDPDQASYVLGKTLHGDGWRFTGYSTQTNPDAYTFWYMNLDDDPFFTTEFLEIIEELTGKRFTIERLYANGQTYGLPGSFHRDVSEDTYASDLYHTFVYYVNPTWSVEWGGETVIVEDEGFATIYPTPNGGCFFRSDVLHIGSEPSRHCKELRVTVAFKLKEII